MTNRFYEFFSITWNLLETTEKYWFLQNQVIKATLMQIWKFDNTFVFIWKYIEDFTQKHILRFETWAREMSEKFVYIQKQFRHSNIQTFKHSIEYVKD